MIEFKDGVLTITEHSAEALEAFQAFYDNRKFRLSLLTACADPDNGKVIIKLAPQAVIDKLLEKRLGIGSVLEEMDNIE